MADLLAMPLLQAKVATKGAVKAREAGYLKAVLSDCMDKASPVRPFYRLVLLHVGIPCSIEVRQSTTAGKCGAACPDELMQRGWI